MNAWVYTREGYHAEDAADNGNRFLIGNGLIGVRGTLEEYRGGQQVAVNLAGIYDRAPGQTWREPINAPNGLFAMLEGQGNVVKHMQQLDMRHGIHLRTTEYTHANWHVERFCSMAEPHVICQRITVEPKDKPVMLICGIDAEVWDINGPHLLDFKTEAGDVLTVAAVTSELGIPITVSERCDRQWDELRRDGNSVYRVFQVTEKFVLERIISVNRDLPPGTYEGKKKSHIAIWEHLWENSAVRIEGNDEAQFYMNNSLYHLHSIAPRHSADCHSALSIPARGLSGQTYKGAIFWDAEIFLFPVFVHTEPELAKTLLRYRIETLPGALIKAEEYGLRGAFYPWESQSGGIEGCTCYNVVDVFTNRPVRTYFRDKQIHISGDIAYTLWRYYELTGDISLLKEGGAEVIFQCARFYLSRAHRRIDLDKVEFLDVVGPDEYHERVDNNVFTNQMAAHCVFCALKLAELFSGSDFLNELMDKLEYGEDLELLKEIEPKIRPSFVEGEVIEQFDRYFELEDCSLDTLRGRLLNEREYWGTNHGVAANTQIIKQADVIAMMALFPRLFSDQTVEKNWYFYEPRTEHGSSLSSCMYALTACRFGRPDLAYPHFMKTASIDLVGGGKQWAGNIYIGGTHPAANGGAWIIAVLGFAGLSVSDGKVSVKPCLPPQIKTLCFPITVKDKKYRVTVGHDDWEIVAVHGKP